MTRKRQALGKASGADAASDAPSPIRILRELHSGALTPAAVPAESRRACVEHMTGEGYSAAEIAELFQVSQRTVYRDLKEIRSANAIELDPAFASTFTGELLQHVRQCIQRLRRISRERDCPHASRVEAERASWTVMREAAETLQRLGYLPTAAHEIRADLTHRVGAAPSVDELHAEFRWLDGVLQDVELDGVRAELAPIGEQIARLKLAEHLRTLGAAAEPISATAPDLDPKEEPRDPPAQ